MTTNQIKAVTATPETLHKRKVAMIILGSIFLIIAISWIIYWFFWGQYRESTDDAYVTGNMVQLMPQVPGTVIEINTDNTQFVQQGQIIVQLDSSDYEIALQKAKGNLAQTVRQVRQFFENSSQANENLIAAKANLTKAELDLKRRKGLVGNRAVSREEMQHFQTALEAAQAAYKASLYQLDAAQALIDKSTVYDHPLVKIARSNLKEAYLNLQRTKIRAPVTGYVAKRAIHPGQQVNLNTAMLAITPLQDTWIDANYKESSLNNMRVNQPVILYADAYPSITYHGKVVGLNSGTGSVFSLLPPQNATGNWIKIVQRLPVRIQIDPTELAKNPLQLGLSMRVTVKTYDRRGTRMPLAPNNLYKYKTNIYEQQIAGAEDLINSILKANSPDLKRKIL
jgi:membrane fusion protein (multidrug efflux system)